MVQNISSSTDTVILFSWMCADSAKAHDMRLCC